MYVAFAEVFISERAAAFFSCVCPQVAVTQPIMIELQAYAPVQNRKQLKYRAPTFVVIQEMMKPTAANAIDKVICQLRSLRLPDDMAQRTETMPDTKYGGQVMTRVIVVENPSALMTDGKKELNPFDARCNVCINVSR
jgi:hypothetical protein